MAARNGGMKDELPTSPNKK